MTSTPATQSYPCPQCGSKGVAYNPKTSTLTCSYCGWQDAIPETLDQVREQSYEQYLQLDPQNLATFAPEAQEVTCPGCSAKMTFTPPQIAGDCPFCGTHINTQPQAADPTLAPNGILPFGMDRKAIAPNLNTWMGSNWFAPNDLKKLAQPEQMQGVYLPFWTYDSFTNSYYRGERGEHYYETETYQERDEETGEMETKTREVRKTHWYSVSGRVERFFDDVLIPATRSVNMDRLKKLEPWNYHGQLKPYEPAFLAGFKVERYQIDMKEGFDMAKQDMAKEIERDVCHDIGGDEQRIHDVRTTYSAITFKHLLLPVWISSYRYRGKAYQVLVNARTGEVQGEHPIAAWKVAIAVSVGVVAAGLIIWVVIANS